MEDEEMNKHQNCSCLDTSLSEESRRVILPELVASYVKNSAIYLGASGEIAELESLIDNINDLSEKARLKGELKRCYNSYEDSKLVKAELEEIVNSFDVRTQGWTYMKVLNSIIKDHAESRNNAHVRCTRKIREWEKRKDENKSGVSKFKKAVSSKLSSLVAPAVGAATAGGAKFFGVDLENSIGLGLAAAGLTYVIEKGVKYLLFRNKPAWILEDKGVAYCDAQIKQLEGVRDEKKSIIYERAYKLAQKAYEHYILGKGSVKKKRVVKHKASEPDDFAVYEIKWDDYKKLHDVEKMAVTYETVRRYYNECPQENTLSPENFQKEAESKLQRLHSDHKEKIKVAFGEDYQPFE